MKWNCGPTYREWYAAINKWHRWFAWHPVRVGSRDCRWLEAVERRGYSCYDGISWEYRALGAGEEV